MKLENKWDTCMCLEAQASNDWLDEELHLEIALGPIWPFSSFLRGSFHSSPIKQQESEEVALSSWLVYQSQSTQDPLFCLFYNFNSAASADSSSPACCYKQTHARSTTRADVMQIASIVKLSMQFEREREAVWRRLPGKVLKLTGSEPEALV